MKNVFSRQIGLSPLQNASRFNTLVIFYPVSGQHLGFGAVSMDSAAGELGRRRRMTDLDASLVAAGFDAVENVKR